jgi:hypothetical protein
MKKHRLVIGLIIVGILAAFFVLSNIFFNKEKSITTGDATGDILSADNRKLSLPDWKNSTISQESNLVNYLYGADDPIKQASNLATPDASVRYVNVIEGISFDVPYSRKWLDEKFKVNPYDEKENIVVFGPVSIVEGGGAARYHTMRMVPQKNAQEIIAEISKIKSKELETYKISNKSEPKISRINGLTVVTYEDGNMAGGAWYVAQIVGKKNNYEFRVDGTWGVSWSNIEKLPAYIESIVKSFRFDS